jgi:hypothetical protein
VAASVCLSGDVETPADLLDLIWADTVPRDVGYVRSVPDEPLDL